MSAMSTAQNRPIEGTLTASQECIEGHSTVILNKNQFQHICTLCIAHGRTCSMNRPMPVCVMPRPPKICTESVAVICEHRVLYIFRNAIGLGRHQVNERSPDNWAGENAPC